MAIAMVDGYDNHRFAEPVPYVPYGLKKKSTTMGWIQLDKPVMLCHNEHDDIEVPAGTYELRQCRSWEANPVGIWTLNID